MRSISAKLFRDFGFGIVHQAGNGIETIQFINNCDVDIVLLDWFMPDMTAPEIIRMVRRAPDIPDTNVPIIVTCTASTKRQIIEARDSGATEFLAKPFSATMLLERVAYSLENPRGFIRNRSYAGPDRRRITPPKPVEVDRRSGASIDATPVD
ncbi:MAG: hypothetical protein Tsb0010_12900 [Parvularculaceae bacterium]